MTPKNLLVPIDFSLGAEHALDYACELARKLDATVHLVNALGDRLPELPAALSKVRLDEMTARHHAELAKLAEARGGVARIGQVRVKHGDPRDAISEAIQEVHADLVIMGTHGRRGIRRMLLGSVAEETVRRAPCPVLVVRTTGSGVTAIPEPVLGHEAS